MERWLRAITGAQNLSHVGKFRVHLSCGHSILYDHTVDSVQEYLDPRQELICMECEALGSCSADSPFLG